MDLVHLPIGPRFLITIFWLATPCSSHVFSDNYDVMSGLKESFFPLEETESDSLGRRFVRQLSSGSTDSTILKRQFSKLNDGISLPEDVVPVNGAKYNATYNTSVYEENHIYYNVSFFPNTTASRRHYVNLDELRNDTTVSHEGLSRAHLKAAGITLSFEFPFYGLKLRNLTLATGGFLFTGNADHSWIAATQYIAPLMADFDFLLHNDSSIRYSDNGTALTIEWKNAVLHEKPQAGPFTFQATLRDDGTIIFYYVKVPLAINSIPNDTHPVKVGISDAYMIDTARFIIRYRTIYEYHRIALNSGDIVSGSALILKPLPTCIAMASCHACVSGNIASGCMWCEKLQRCSDGIDRFHQEWHSAGCPLSATNSTCAKVTLPALQSSTTTPSPSKVTKPASATAKVIPVVDSPPKKAISSSNVSDYSTGGRSRPVPSTDPNSIMAEKSKYTIIQNNETFSEVRKRPLFNDPYVTAQNLATPGNYGIAIAAVLSVAAIGSVLSWVVYAYLRPHSTSGQWLIKYRPNQWRRNREDEIQIANTAF